MSTETKITETTLESITLHFPSDGYYHAPFRDRMREAWRILTTSERPCSTSMTLPVKSCEGTISVSSALVPNDAGASFPLALPASTQKIQGTLTIELGNAA
jgi:hypothetical protein